MGRFDFYRHSTIQENYECQVFKLKTNSKYEYETTPIIFRCSPASNNDIKHYRITKGVYGSKESVYLIASNLPDDINEGDRVVFMNKTLNVESVGFYLNDSGIVDASIMSNEYLQARCPKGLTLK